MEIKHAALVIVDISGYTNFLRYRNLSLLHAEDIITQLLESVIDAAEFPLILNKLEGDAAFLYALMDGDHARAAQDILQQVLAFFPAFHRKAAELSQDTAQCDCDACTQIDRLKLKAFLHHGEVVVKRIRQFEELAGDNVILIHRLLKNTVSTDEYILMTKSFSELTEGISGFKKEGRIENYKNIGKTEIDVFYPQKGIAPLKVTPSVTRKFSRSISRTQRLISHITGISRINKFRYIPNRKISLLGILKDMFGL